MFKVYLSPDGSFISLKSFSIPSAEITLPEREISKKSRDCHDV